MCPARASLFELSPAGVTAWIAFVEQRFDLLGIELGRRWGGFLVGGWRLGFALFSARRLGLASSLASASATWSGLTSATFFSGSAGLVSGTGGGASRAALTSFFSTTFGSASSTAFGLCDLFDQRLLRSTLGRPCCPWSSRENSDTLTMSTGSASLGGVGSGLAANDSTLHNNTDAVPDRRDGVGLIDFPVSRAQRPDPCSTSVTKATRRKPAADIRPITFITVP